MPAEGGKPLGQEVFGHAPAREKAVLEQAFTPQFACVWRPEPSNRPQAEAYQSKADLLLYGGAAGGGKTDLLIGLALMEHARGDLPPLLCGPRRDRAAADRNSRQPVDGWEREMKARQENSNSSGAESVAAMTLIGAIAQSLVLLGPQYESAVYSALDAAASSLEILAMGSADSGETDYVEALRIVEQLRAHMPPAGRAD